MRRIIAAAALLIAPSLFAHDHGQNVSISTDDYEEVTSCGQIRVSFDDAPAVRAEEELPVASLRSLKINSDQRGAVRVAGWDQPRYAVTVCKAEACRDMKRSWHDDDDRSPRQLSFGSGARNVTLSTVNGPVSVKEVD